MTATGVDVLSYLTHAPRLDNRTSPAAGNASTDPAVPAEKSQREVVDLKSPVAESSIVSPLTGIWLSQDTNSLIEIRQDGDLLHGKGDDGAVIPLTYELKKQSDGSFAGRAQGALSDAGMAAPKNKGFELETDCHFDFEMKLSQVSDTRVEVKVFVAAPPENSEQLMAVWVETCGESTALHKSWKEYVWVRPTTTADGVISSFSGTGIKNTRPFSAVGPFEIQWVAKGTYFGIYLYSADGTLIGVHANQKGSGAGSSFVPQPGNYYLSVNSTGKWTVDIVAVK